MKRVILALACFSLSACGTLNFRPTLDADPAETGIEGLAYINTLWSAYEPIPAKDQISIGNGHLCDFTAPQYQQRDNDSYERYYFKKEKTEDRLKCLRFKKTENIDDVKTYLQAGFALSDLYCKVFFRRVANHEQQRGFARNNVNDVGAAVSTILGLTSVSSKVVGGIGAGFGLSDGIFRTYDQQFLVSADLANVQKIVNAAQQDYAGKTFKLKIDNYFDASRAVADHANFCSFLGMKTLVNASVVSNTEKIKPADEATSKSDVAASIPKSPAELEADAQATLAAAHAVAISAHAKQIAADAASAKAQSEAQAAAAQEIAAKSKADAAAAAKVIADKAAADKAAIEKAAEDKAGDAKVVKVPTG